MDGDGELEDSGRGFGGPVVDAGNLRSMWKAVWHNDLLVDEMKEMNWKKTKPRTWINCNAMTRIEMNGIEINPHVMKWHDLKWYETTDMKRTEIKRIEPNWGDFWSARVVLTGETTSWTSAFEDWLCKGNWWLVTGGWLISSTSPKMKGWFLYSWSRETDWFVLVAKSSLRFCRLLSCCRWWIW